MLSLAVSIVLCQAASSKLDDAVLAPAWAKIQASVVVVMKGESRRGTAALIDAQGYFITGRSVLAGNGALEGLFADGTRITLFPVASDAPTQLALLRTYDRIGDRHAVPLYRLPLGEVVDATHPKILIAALADGPTGAQLVNTRTLALVGNGHEVINVNEIHFDGRPGRVAGAPVFTLEGSLVGVLSAMLEHKPRVGAAFEGGAPRQNIPRPSFAGQPAAPSQGDSVLYSPGFVVMQRVITGFLTPEHAVVRPAIGVFCQDSPESGALVDAVLDDSPADLAGIKEGDVIISIDGAPIRKAFDFGRTMLRQTVGSTISISARRHGRVLDFKVRVGM